MLPSLLITSSDSAKYLFIGKRLYELLVFQFSYSFCQGSAIGLLLLELLLELDDLRAQLLACRGLLGILLSVVVERCLGVRHQCFQLLQLGIERSALGMLQLRGRGDHRSVVDGKLHLFRGGGLATRYHGGEATEGVLALSKLPRVLDGVDLGEALQVGEIGRASCRERV